MELGGTRWNCPEIVRLDFGSSEGPLHGYQSGCRSSIRPVALARGTKVTEGGRGRGQGTLSEEVCLLSTRGLGPGGREEEAQLALDCAGRQTEA